MSILAPTAVVKMAWALRPPPSAACLANKWRSAAQRLLTFLALCLTVQVTHATESRAIISAELSRAIQQAPAQIIRGETRAAASQPPANPASGRPDLAEIGALVRPAGNGALAGAAISRAVAFGELRRVTVNAAQAAAINEAVSQRVTSEAGGGTVIPLPDVFLTRSESGEQFQLKYYVLVGQPLIQQDDKTFKGNIHVGVTALNAYSGSRQLSTPAHFGVLETQLATPSNVVVSRVGQPLEPIAIRANPVGNTVSVHVTTDEDVSGTEIKVPVSPTIIVRPESQTVQGYGVEALRLHVLVLGIEDPQGREVQLRAEPGAYFDNPLVLKADGSGDIMMRARGTGPVSIFASLGGMESRAVNLDAQPPLETLTWSLGGGLLGGLVRLLTTRSRRSSYSRKAIALLTSVLIGFFMLLLYIGGIRIMSLYPSTSATNIAVATVAALAAFLGPKALVALRGGDHG